MYDLVKVVVANLLMPLPVCLGLGVLGLVLLRWRRRVGVAFVVLGLGGLLLASWPPVADRLLAPLENRHPALMTLPEDPDLAAVVVLGGGWEPGSPRSAVGRLSDSSALRLMEGLRLWRQRPELALIVSGASRDPKVAPVARGYAAAATEFGVPASRLVVLDTPTDTGLEARAVRNALGEGSRVVVVTSASHLPRAMQHFRRAGLQPLAAPTHYLARHQRHGGLQEWVPSASELRKTERALYEALGRLAVSWEQ